MGQAKYAYVVCAKVYGNNNAGPPSSEVMAGQPVVRRLNRMERVALAFAGTLVRRTPHALLIAFDTAEAAFFGACEMQRRCADLQQTPSQRWRLQIGIHRAATEARTRAAWAGTPQNERRNPARRLGFDAADRLADVAHDDGIVVSAPVLETLAPTVRQTGEAVDNADSELHARAFYWRTPRK